MEVDYSSSNLIYLQAVKKSSCHTCEILTDLAVIVSHEKKTKYNKDKRKKKHCENNDKKMSVESNSAIPFGFALLRFVIG